MDLQADLGLVTVDLLDIERADKGQDLLVLRRGLLLLDQVDLVLQDDDVLQLHDLHRGQVLRRLRLRAGFVPRDEQQRGVHHRRDFPGTQDEWRAHTRIVPRFEDGRIEDVRVERDPIALEVPNG